MHPTCVYAYKEVVLDIEKYRSASLAGIYLLGFYNVSWVMMLSLQSSNNAGLTKKSFTGVSVAIFYGKTTTFHPPSAAKLQPMTIR